MSDYAKQVFDHDFTVDQSGMVEVRFRGPAFNANQDVGVALRCYSSAYHPVFIQWKMMRKGL